MSSIWSNGISVSLFGESHGQSIGVTIDGAPSGYEINYDKLETFMKRRSASKNPDISTTRIELDKFEIISGISNDRTTGAPITAIIKNNDTISSNYKPIKYTPRPGHSDYTYNQKYKGFNDYRGGGHSSGRLTAGLTFAGAISEQILKFHNIHTAAHIKSIKDIEDDSFNPTKIKKSDLENLKSSKLPLLNMNILPLINHIIKNVKDNKDSIGGTLECGIIGIPAGVGSPIFKNLKSLISSIVFGIPAVQGIEFGAGFSSTKLRGSENNDNFFINECGQIKTYTNNHGGILGGISSGMPIIFNVAIKPTSSISIPQKTVNMKTKKNTVITVKGRHDPCIVPRVIPVIESAASIAMLSELIKSNFI